MPFAASEIWIVEQAHARYRVGQPRPQRAVLRREGVMLSQRGEERQQIVLELSLGQPQRGAALRRSTSASRCCSISLIRAIPSP
jgi:hypothetical protein